MNRSNTRYSQIYEYYQQQIEEGALVEGQQMPTEEEICLLFQVSRITVRRAMGELVRDGYIQRIQGKGSYVRVKTKDMQLNHLQGFTEEMRNKGFTVSTKVLAVEVQKSDRRVAEALQLEQGALVISIERLRLVEGEPLSVEHVYLSYGLCPEILSCDLSGSLYQIFAQYGLKAERATQNIAAGFSPKPICELLRIKQTMPTLNIERVSRLADGRPLEYVLSAYRADRYTFHVDLSRKP